MPLADEVLSPLWTNSRATGSGQTPAVTGSGLGADAVDRRYAGSDRRAASAPTAPAAANDQPGPALSMTSPANGAPRLVPAVSAEPSRPIAPPRAWAGTSRLSASFPAGSVGAPSTPAGGRGTER